MTKSRKRAQKRAKPRQNYKALYRYTELRREELEKRYAEMRVELEDARALYEKAFPENVRLSRELSEATNKMLAYRQRLAGMLTNEQRDFAKVARCPEDEYAMQLIRLCQRKIDELSSLTGRYP